MKNSLLQEMKKVGGAGILVKNICTLSSATIPLTCVIRPPLSITNLSTLGVMPKGGLLQSGGGRLANRRVHNCVTTKTTTHSTHLHCACLNGG